MFLEIDKEVSHLQATPQKLVNLSRHKPTMGNGSETTRDGVRRMEINYAMPKLNKARVIKRQGEEPITKETFNMKLNSRLGTYLLVEIIGSGPKNKRKNLNPLTLSNPLV